MPRPIRACLTKEISSTTKVMATETTALTREEMWRSAITNCELIAVERTGLELHCSLSRWRGAPLAARSSRVPSRDCASQSGSSPSLTLNNQLVENIVQVIANDQRVDPTELR
jgi:hypothetical protein